ncbi:MAG TPA: ATP-binding protein, partial [Pirellulales bacterium]|nr:ATP-binding protein [Pirellulales bacterium]
LAFPLLRDNVVSGVMEFHGKIDEPTQPLLNNLKDIGSSICQYIEIEIGKEKALEHERELIKSKQIEDDSRQKDEFLAVLAHELRNPLSPLSNALQLWPHVKDSKADVEYLRAVMERQVKQLTRLIDDLLDVSRVTRGKIELRRQTVAIAALLAAAVEVVQPQLDAYEHHLTITVPEEPIYVDGDKARLIQVFANILNNAVKYTNPKGSISVTVARHTDKVAISFRDNGLGIPESMLSQIFELFRQVDKSLDRSHGGLGIGLTLARRLVELHDGTLSAHSEGPGRGSEFVVTLSALAGAPKGPDKLRSNAAARRVVELPPNRILVADDLKDSADTLAMLLRSLGQQAWVVNDGKSAIEWILTNRPDVAFLDISMPGMDGYRIAGQLRKHAELRGTVLIAFTGYGQPKDRKEALEAGFDFHLTKPTNVQDLEELLLRLPAPAGVTRQTPRSLRGR